MREIRQSGSEGGGGETNRLSLPLFSRLFTQARSWWFVHTQPTRTQRPAPESHQLRDYCVKSRSRDRPY